MSFITVPAIFFSLRTAIFLAALMLLGASFLADTLAAFTPLFVDFFDSVDFATIKLLLLDIYSLILPHVAGFVNFIREQGVVGMAVGLAIGTAAGDTVKKLVTAFIDPLVQLIVGSQQGLQSASFTVEVAGRKGEFLYGAFVSSLITLIAVAFVVYAIIHFLKLDKLDKKKD